VVTDRHPERDLKPRDRSMILGVAPDQEERRRELGVGEDPQDRDRVGPRAVIERQRDLVGVRGAAVDLGAAVGEVLDDRVVVRLGGWRRLYRNRA
jgi:hypothetical protein